jgi:hypothetical protein
MVLAGQIEEIFIMDTVLVSLRELANSPESK